MKCQNLKALFILSAVFFFSFSVLLSAEWCYSDEQKAQLDKTFEELETERIEQERKLRMQAMLLEVAEKSIAIFWQETKDIKALSRKAEISWQAERIELILKSGATGIGIGLAFGIIIDIIIEYIKAQKQTIIN